MKKLLKVVRAIAIVVAIASIVACAIHSNWLGTTINTIMLTANTIMLTAILNA